jgi:uncharacterized membrane protein
MAMGSIAVCLAYEYKVCVPGLSPEQARWLAKVDLCYFGAAMIALGTGIARVLWFGKGLDFYTGNPVFYIKLALFLALGLISLPPTLQFLSWRRAMRERSFEVSDYQVLRVRRFCGGRIDSAGLYSARRGHHGAGHRHSRVLSVTLWLPGTIVGGRGRHFALPMLCCGVLCAPPVHAAHRYEVAVAASLERISVHACFDGSAPSQLVAESDGAQYLLESARASDQTLSVSAGTLSLTGVAENSCIDYRVRLQPVSSGAQSGGPETRWIGEDLLTSIGDWLWRPAENPNGIDIVVQFHLPPGISVSAPWPRNTSTDGRHEYQIGATPLTWPGVVAFGQFSEQESEIGDARLRIAVLDGPTPAQEQWLREGVERAARQATRVYGRFPVDLLQVIVAQTPRGRGPVPWAYVSRGGGPAVHLFVVPQRGKQAYFDDWSAVHEMAHLFFPYVAGRDAWLFEGLPTYLQNVLMARDGAISAEEAWRRMVNGFRRGARISPSLSLSQVAERMGHGGNYLRVYWAGAAVMLAADLQLRSLSAGSQSLDTALASLAQCCLKSNRRWSADELIAALDELTATTVFSDLWHQQIETGKFPDFETVLERAGVQVENGRVGFLPNALWAAEREALMRPR